jgi:hypothetical protein
MDQGFDDKQTICLQELVFGITEPPLSEAGVSVLDSGVVNGRLTDTWLNYFYESPGVCLSVCLSVCATSSYDSLTSLHSRSLWPNSIQALHSAWPCVAGVRPNILGADQRTKGVMGAMFSCFTGGNATRRISDSSDSDDDKFDPRKKGYNPYAVETATMGDASPAPKSNILLPLYVYPNPEAWTPLHQT